MCRICSTQEQPKKDKEEETSMGRKKTYERVDALGKARDLFWAKGYEGTHLQELVEVTGVNRFSLYAEFGGKDGLFREALGDYIAQAQASYDAVLGSEPMGLGNIRTYFSGITFTRDYAGCFLINTLTEKHVVPPEAFKLATKTAKHTQGLFLANLEAAVASAELEQDRDVIALSKLLTAIDQGLAIYGIISPSNKDKEVIVAQLDALLGPVPNVSGPLVGPVESIEDEVEH